MSRTLVIGIGNPWRGDDGVGAAVVRALSAHPEVDAVHCQGEPAELMERWSGYEHVILVDALMTGADPGSLLRLTAQTPLPYPARHSSHGLGLVEAIELARALDALPPELVIFGIEVESLQEGAGLSPVVAEAVSQLTMVILAEVRHCETQSG